VASQGVTTINFSGSMPDAVRKSDGCWLSFAMFHVTEDRFQRNAPLLNKRAQTLPFQPMSLNLYYLLTANCEKDFLQEQQAMSMALQYFYQTPVVKTAVNIPGITPAVNEEFTMTMEMQTSDDLARFWQGVAVPMRLSVVYKVSVVLLTPPATPQLALPVQTARLSANPAMFPYTLSGEAIGTARSYNFATPLSTSLVPDIATVEYSPAVVAPGQRFVLYGSNLNQAGPPPLPAVSYRVFFVVPGQPDIDVTDQWKTHKGQPDEKHFQTESLITLDLPATIGAPPANAPPPGVYQICAGSDHPPDPGSNRTNSVPFSIAARIDVSVLPPDPPILAPVAGVYSLSGEGFVAGHSEVLLDTIALNENSGAPSDGEFNVGSPQAITFRTPAGIPTGRYTVRVRVNQVESPPSWWISI
jgi:hypothetical protein